MRQRSIISLIAFLSLLIPSFVQADGMMVSPQESWMQETGQKAAILYQDGVETLVLSTSFQGNAKDFGWIVPVPAKPDVTKGSQELFTNLAKYTQQYPRVLHDDVYNLGIEAKGTSEVSIVEEKQIDYYDVTVLTATDSVALSRWFVEHDYAFPDAAKYLLSQYIQDKWYFVAMRVNPEALAVTDVTQQLRNGAATPVVLRFATAQMVYPLRISKPYIADSGDVVPLNTLKLVDGKFGKAVSLEQGQTMTFAANSFPNDAGTIEMQVKPLVLKSCSANRVLLSASDGSSLFQLRLVRDCTTQKEYLEYTWAPKALSDGSVTARQSLLTWRTANTVTLPADAWTHVALTWSYAQQPIFYVNGVANPAVGQQGTSAWVGERIGAGDKMTIGGLMSSSSSAFQGSIDEVVLWEQGLSPERITERAIQALPLSVVQCAEMDPSLRTSVIEPCNTTPEPPNGVTAYGSFNSAIELIGESGASILRYRDSWYPVQPTSTAKRYSTQPMTLYILSGERVDATSFSTAYANWFSEKNVRDLAFATDGTPLLAANGKKFVTVLTRSLSASETPEDVFFRKAATQEKIGLSPDDSGTSEQQLGFWLFLGGTMFFTLVLAFFLIRSNRKPPQASPSMPAR